MFRLHRSPVVAFALLALPLALGACSKDSKSPTAPGTPKELSSGDLGQGGSYAHDFAAAGTYPYHCARHGSMTGSVSIAGGGADSVLVHISGFAFVPQTTPPVKPGGRVRWVNDDASAHTVTSD